MTRKNRQCRMSAYETPAMSVNGQMGAMHPSIGINVPVRSQKQNIKSLNVIGNFVSVWHFRNCLFIYLVYLDGSSYRIYQ